MCELLGFNSNKPVELVEPLRLFQKRGGETADNPDGWGLAYWHSKNWQLYKAAEAAAQSTQFASVSENLRTNLLIAHVRKANPPSASTPENTHPFVRNCCGRPWTFAHNGKVVEVTEPGGCCHPHQSQPEGETDSEHAFYFLLDEIAHVFSDTDKTTWVQHLATLSEAIAAYGQFNFLMSDGAVLIAYGHDRLHRLQRRDDDFKTILLASEPLSNNEPWEAFKTGELQLYQNGEIIGSIQTTPAWISADSKKENGRD